MAGPAGILERQTGLYWTASRALMRGDAGMSLSNAAEGLVLLTRYAAHWRLRGAALGALASIGLDGIEAIDAGREPADMHPV